MAQYATGKFAKGVCDVCGFAVPYKSLRPQWRDWRKTSLWVCAECVDKGTPRKLGAVHDPQALHHPRPDTSLEASRRILHWRPVDTFVIRCRLGEFRVLA